MLSRRISMGFDESNGDGDANPGHIGVGLNKTCERCGKSGAWVKGCHSRRGETEVYHDFSPGSLCRGCHMDLLPDPQILYTELLSDEFTFFYGAASGSSRKALRKMEESHVMVSYATQNSGRIGPERVHFVDSGGAPDMFTKGRFEETGDYVTSDSDYLDYVADVDADLWSLRDYPCEDSVLEKHDRTVKEHQQMTTDRHRALLDRAEQRGITGQPVSILQGQSINDYLTHLDQLKDAGALTDYIGIGSVCRRHKEQAIGRIIEAVRDALSERHALHAFGVKKSVLSQTDAMEHLTSADSCAYDFGLRMEAQYGDERYWWKSVLAEYLEYKREIGEMISSSTDEAQATWDDFEESTESPLHI